MQLVFHNATSIRVVFIPRGPQLFKFIDRFRFEVKEHQKMPLTDAWCGDSDFEGAFGVRERGGMEN